MAKSDKLALNDCGDVCRYCGGDLSGLSDHGRLNHVEFCRIVVGVPNVKISRHTSPEATVEKQGVGG